MKFSLPIRTIDNNILEFDKDMYFDCDKVVPIGNDVIRMFNSSECIVSKEVFIFYYEGHRYGISGENLSSFVELKNQACDDCCYITYAGCFVTYKGQNITYNV